MKVSKEELIQYTKQHLKSSSDFGPFYRIKDIKILEVTINKSTFVLRFVKIQQMMGCNRVTDECQVHANLQHSK